MNEIRHSVDKNAKVEYEVCVVCKKKTDVRIDESITRRYTYIEGAGQLCPSCYKKLIIDAKTR